MTLHFTEIADKVNDKINDRSYHLEHRRAHGLLIDTDKFAHSGIRGTYGLTKWGLRKESTVELIEECLKKAGFPLHWRQIFNYVSKYKNSKIQSILSLLENNRKFVRKDSGVYWFNELQ